MANKDKVMRGMPHNEEAEVSVLGAMLIDNKAADNVLGLLKQDDFYFAQHRQIYEAMRNLQSRGVPIDTVSVADELELNGKLDEIGSISYLTELAERVPSSANAGQYVKMLKRDSMLRRIIESGNKIVEKGYESTSSVEAREFAEKQIYDLAEQEEDKELKKIDQAAADAMKGIQAIQAGEVPTSSIRTGFNRLDEMTHGLKAGELILLAARPSVGKTAFSLNIAANASIKYGKTVAIFSLEMPSALLAKRMLAYVGGVPISQMDKRGMLTAEGNGTLYKAYNALLGANIYIDDYSMNGPGDVLSKCRRLKREIGSLDLIIIDYLQLMTLGENDGERANRTESRQVEVSTMSRKMKIFAKELGVPIILLSQMSRGVEQRIDHTPLLSDLRESGSIEQDADVVMFLSNPSKYNPALPSNQVTLDIKKNRNGPIGEIPLEWNGDTTSFREWVDSESIAVFKDGEGAPQQETKANSEFKAELEKTEDKPQEKADEGLTKVESEELESFEEVVEDLPFDLEDKPQEEVLEDEGLPFDQEESDGYDSIDVSEDDDDEYVDE